MTAKTSTHMFHIPHTTDIPGISAVIGALIAARGVMGNMPGMGDPNTAIQHPIDEVRLALTKEVLRLSESLKILCMGHTVTLKGAVNTGQIIILTFDVQEDDPYVSIT